MDVESRTAIDVDVHIEVGGDGRSALPADLAEAASRYFAADGPRPDLDTVAHYARERRMAALVFTVDAETHLHNPPIFNEEIAEGAARNNDVLIPFASVDPNRPDTTDRARRFLEDHGVRGFKINQRLTADRERDERLLRSPRGGVLTNS